MRKQIRRLRLREGDILLVSDSHLMKQLMNPLQLKGVPSVPIVYCPGSVKRLSKEYLQKLLERAS